MNPHKESLERIADQAQVLVIKARALNMLYDQLCDKGQAPPARREIDDAVLRLRCAFMAVLRVTSEYL